MFCFPLGPLLPHALPVPIRSRGRPHVGEHASALQQRREHLPQLLMEGICGVLLHAAAGGDPGHQHFQAVALPHGSEVSPAQKMEVGRSRNLISCRFVNPNPYTVIGIVKVTPDNSNDNEQFLKVQFKNSSQPVFTVVSGDSGNIASPMVLNPGRWSVSITINDTILLVSFSLNISICLQCM